MVYVCRGSDCRGEKKAFAALVDALDDVPTTSVRCQKICKGPVVGLPIDGRLEWFARIRHRKLREAVLRAIGGDLTKRLWRQRVKKRRGKLRD